MPPQSGQQSNPADAAAIMTAIQKMLQGVQSQTQDQRPDMIPGQKPPGPTPNIQFNTGGSGSPISITPNRPQATQIPPTGSQGIGSFENKRGAVNAGLTSLGNSLSGMFGAIEQKEQAKKSALAENYMLQINSLLASGDPGDKEKAMHILEDPKIRKILKTGLEFVPLEEEVPPEAKGVMTAQQKIASGKAPQIGGQQQQQQPQKRPIISQPNQQQQLQAAMTNALLQKIKQDPASAISMMGGSQLSSAEERAAEFYKAGLGLSPADVATMSSAEKLQGLKTLEASTVAAIKGEIDMYKAGVGYKGKVDSAQIAANAKKYVANTVKEAWKDRKSGTANNAAAAKIYEDYGKKYLDIIKSGKGPDGKPLSEDQIKQYQQKADSYQQQADDLLSQVGDKELMDMFQKALENEPDDKEPNEQPDPNEKK
jgi:hypothetical protein